MCCFSFFFLIYNKGKGTPITPGASTVRMKSSPTERPRSSLGRNDSNWGGSSLVASRPVTRSSTQKNKVNNLRYNSQFDFYSSDDEYSPRKRRKSLRKKPKTPETITLSSDSESDVEKENSQFKVRLLYSFLYLTFCFETYNQCCILSMLFQVRVTSDWDREIGCKHRLQLSL